MKAESGGDGKARSAAPRKQRELFPFVALFRPSAWATSKREPASTGGVAGGADFLPFFLPVPGDLWWNLRPQPVLPVMRTSTSSSRNRPPRREEKVCSPAASAPEPAPAPSPACRPKVPVPVGAVWWSRAEGHPCLRFFGEELRFQRAKVRGWSLDDLNAACGLSKSFISELESGKKMPSEEAILELEAGMGMVDGGLMALVRRRWKKAVTVAAQK